MKDSCSLTEFYLMLKLGFFKSSQVEDVGYLSSATIHESFLSKPLNEYKEQTFAKKQLAIGLYLLDSFLLTKYENNQGVYILVVCVCRTNLNNKDKIYALRLSQVPADSDIVALISGEVTQKKRTPYFRRKSRRSYLDSNPMNAIPRRDVLRL